MFNKIPFIVISKLSLFQIIAIFFQKNIYIQLYGMALKISILNDRNYIENSLIFLPQVDIFKVYFSYINSLQYIFYIK